MSLPKKQMKEWSPKIGRKGTMPWLNPLHHEAYEVAVSANEVAPSSPSLRCLYSNCPKGLLGGSLEKVFCPREESHFVQEYTCFERWYWPSLKGAMEPGASLPAARQSQSVSTPSFPLSAPVPEETLHCVSLLPPQPCGLSSRWRQRCWCCW